MSNSTSGEARRAFLRSALEVAGAAVLASTVVPAVQASIVEASGTPQARADRLTIVSNQDVTDDSEALIRHVNNAFVNGGFGKGALRQRRRRRAAAASGKAASPTAAAAVSGTAASPTAASAIFDGPCRFERVGT